MSFSLDTVTLAWQRSGGRCECTRAQHPWHQGEERCGKSLSIRDRRRGECSGAWEADHKTPDDGDDLENCEVVCWQCHLAGLRAGE